jgi:hypothetical protein
LPKIAENCQKIQIEEAKALTTKDTKEVRRIWELGRNGQLPKNAGIAKKSKIEGQKP